MPRPATMPPVLGRKLLMPKALLYTLAAYPCISGISGRCDSVPNESNLFLSTITVNLVKFTVARSVPRRGAACGDGQFGFCANLQE